MFNSFEEAVQAKQAQVARDADVAGKDHPDGTGQTPGPASGKLQEGCFRHTPYQDRLKADMDNLGSQLDRSVRAYNILERHPEFEEFIQLLGLIRVPIRCTPLRSDRALVTE